MRLVQDGKYITNYSELQEFLINDEGNIVKNNSTELPIFRVFWSLFHMISVWLLDPIVYLFAVVPSLAI